MTHDFAKKPNKNKPKNTKKRAAEKNQTPGWVWFFTGIVTGLFIWFLAYLANISPQPEANHKAIAKTQAKPAEKKTSTTKFDFYTLLPEREVIVPDQHEEASVPTQATIYILQAGSFKKSEDADRLRAKLILMGLNTKVEQVASANGERWHRVQVGPFQDRSSLSKARNLLINKGIDTLLLKRKT